MKLWILAFVAAVVASLVIFRTESVDAPVVDEPTGAKRGATARDVQVAADDRTEVANAAVPSTPAKIGESLLVHAESASGSPVPGASVRVYRRGAEKKCTTDGLGRARVPTEARGPWSVDVVQGDLFGRRHRVFSGQEITVRMERRLHVRCMVVDRAGGPIDAALVRILSGNRFVAGARTDALGQTEVLRVPGGGLSAMVDSSVSVRTMHPMADGEIPPVWTLVVDRLPHLLSGVVTHAGRRLAGAVVRQVGTRNHLRAVTAKDGSFTLGRYSQGDRPIFVVEHPETSSALRSVTIGDHNEHVLIEVRSGREVAVEVHDEEGRPVEGADVKAAWSLGYGHPGSPPVHVALARSGVSSAQGVCTLRGLPAGSIRFEVRHRDFNDAALQVSGEVARIRLSPRHDWSWRVDLGDQAREVIGRERWTMTLTSKNGPNDDERRSFGETDRTGRATFRRLPEGTYGAQVESPDGNWCEFFDLEVHGDAGSFEAPTVVVCAPVGDTTGPGVTVRGKGFRSRLRKIGSEWVGLCRPGRVTVETNGSAESRDFVIPESVTRFNFELQDGGLRK